MTLPLLATAALAILGAGLGPSDTPPREGTIVTTQASGTFDVTVNPAAQEEFPDGISLGRFSLDKQYHGDLEATAKGEMLTAQTAVEGSAGYVAVERVDGTLHGKRGTFALQHLGTMSGGDQHLTITVVPDSGTAELEGLDGKLTITVADGKHSYELDYSLPEP